MIRTLLIIAGAALVLCIACFTGAAAIGGRDFVRAVEDGDSWGWTWDGDGDFRRFRRIESGPRVTRTLTWTGGDSLTSDMAADVIYSQDETASVTVSGRQVDVDRLRLEGGRLTMTSGDHEGGMFFGGDGLTITVSAPSVRTFHVDGSGDLDIRGYDQDTIALDISGSGDVEAAGRARSLTFDGTASGEAYLAPLEVTDAKVSMTGSGDVEISAMGAVDADISGSGDLHLARRPANLATADTGSGDVIQD